MKRKRRTSHAHFVVARRRHAAIHVIATFVVLMGAEYVLEKLTGIPRNSIATLIPSKGDWIRTSRQVHPIITHLNGTEALLDYTFHNNSRRTVERMQSRHDTTQEQAPWFPSDWNHPDDNAECITMHEWQRPSKSPYSCNLLYEIMDDATHLDLIGCGGDRCAYQVTHAHDNVVLKLPK